MALWPDSTMNAVSVTGAVRLPARSRATAYLSLGAWNQDEDLLPFTINSAVAPIPLDRPTAEAKAQIASGQTSDHLEGVSAFLEKRQARFQGA